MSEETKTSPQAGREEKKYMKTVRRKVVIEEVIPDRPDNDDYKPVTFRFYNEEQRDVPVFYEWIDKWTKIGECKGYMYNGGVYTLPKIVYEYYKNHCQEPIYSNVEEEIIPGKSSKVSRIVGQKPKYRMDVIQGSV
jgi:hypothetical protein